MWRIATFTILSVLALTIPAAAWAKIALFGLVLFATIVCLFMTGIAETEELLKKARPQQQR